MWFTIIIIIDIFLFVAVPVLFLKLSLITEAFLLFAYYYLYKPKQWTSFREWKVWEFIRNEILAIDVRGPGKQLYFDPESLREEEEKFIFAMHPHTLFAVSLTFFFVLNRSFVKFKAVGTSLLFAIPIVREFVSWAGTIHAREYDMRHALKNGQGLLICPGGMREVVRRGNHIVERSGFIRLAMEFDAKLVPVWSTNEKNFYRIRTPLGSFFLDRFPMYPWPVLAWGHKYIPFLPQPPQEKCRVYIGEPISIVKGDLLKTKEKFYKAMRDLRAQSIIDEFVNI